MYIVLINDSVTMLVSQREEGVCSTFSSVRSFTGMDRNGPNYRNGLPEWTLTCAPEYFLCTLLGQSGLK